MTHAQNLFAVLVITGAVACGDPLVTDEYRGDPIFSLHGKVQLPATASSETDADALSAGVLFIRRGTPEGGFGLQLALVRAELQGEFPAQFTLNFMDTPPLYALDGWDIGLFAPMQAPELFANGYLVVGPSAALDNLPSEVSNGFREGLLPLLDDVTVTAIEVLYAHGVDADDRLYPSVADDGTAAAGTGLPIQEGFNLVDARRFFVNATYSQCVEDVLGATYDLPAYAECLNTSAERVVCEDLCGSDPDYNTYMACIDACAEQYPEQLSRNQCLVMVAQPTIESLCGPYPETTTWPDLVTLDPTSTLTVTLMDDDVKAGLALMFQGF